MKKFIFALVVSMCMSVALVAAPKGQVKDIFKFEKSLVVKTVNQGDCVTIHYKQKNTTLVFSVSYKQALMLHANPDKCIVYLHACGRVKVVSTQDAGKDYLPIK